MSCSIDLWGTFTPEAVEDPYPGNDYYEALSSLYADEELLF